MEQSDPKQIAMKKLQEKYKSLCNKLGRRDDYPDLLRETDQSAMLDAISGSLERVILQNEAILTFLTSFYEKTPSAKRNLRLRARELYEDAYMSQLRAHCAAMEGYLERKENNEH